MTPDNIIDKLQKIMALTRSPIEGEAQAATEMLQKLLTKHNLEIADLEAKGRAAPGVVEANSNSALGVTRAKWKLDVAEAIAKHFYCHPIIDHKFKSVLFIGRPENVESLQAMYRWLLIQVYEISVEQRKEHPEIGPIRWHNNFISGLASRLGARLDEARRRQQEIDPDAMALVVHHDSEIADYMEETYGYRTDGKLTKREQERRDAYKRREQELADLKQSDPEAYYKIRPWDRPLTPEQQAVRDAEDARYAKQEAAKERARERARERRGGGGRRWTRSDDLRWEADEQKMTARQAGRDAAHLVNLEPFVGTSSSRNPDKLT